MCISDTSREHRLSRSPRGGSRHPCICLDTCGGIDTIISLRRAIPCPSTRPPSCLHTVSATPELVGDAGDALPSAITTVITCHRHCPDIANISTQCANIEIFCTTLVPRPIKFHGTCLTAALLNSQSARNKADLIGEAVIEHDILALTETWLTNTPKNVYYTKELSFSGYKLINVPSPGGGGHSGGVAIIHNDGLAAETVATAGAGYTTFEHCDVQFTNNSGLLNIIVVYRPPPTERNGHMIGAFLDEFRSLLEDRMSSLGRLVILGDLNFHVDNAADFNATKFLDLIDLLNFSQHVTSITHKAGHTLDLVITCDSEAVIDNVIVSDLRSDLALVLVCVKHVKPLPTRITTINHKLRGLDAALLAAEVSTIASKTVHTDASLDSIAEKYNFILAAALDKFATCHTKTVTRHPSQPWYIDNLHEAKSRRR